MAQLTGSDLRFMIEHQDGTTWTGLAGLVSISEQEVYEGVREWSIDMRGMGALTETVNPEPWGFESTGEYMSTENYYKDVRDIVTTLAETAPPVCRYCGGTFGADDVRCRGCGCDVTEALQ